ncbi:hypothetical protein EDD11_006759 [Mortierella claussenii]|nr:hypothetical protein EDD11_006759 [Mortierella claussenii]
MDRNTSAVKRYQPYARPTQRRQQPVPAPREEDLFQNIPSVIVGFVKKSLSWLGITQDEDEEEHNHHPALQKELNTTKGDFEFLPGADKEGESSTIGSGSSNSKVNHKAKDSSQDDKEKLYPDLREYITSLKSTTGDNDSLRRGKRLEPDSDGMDEMMAPERQAHRSKLRKGLEIMGPNDEDEDIDIASDKISDEDIKVDDELEDDQKDTLAHSSAKTEEEIEGLSKEELILLGRIRKLTETPLERARRNVRSEKDKISRDFVTPYSLIRMAREEPEPAPREAPKPLDTILPYNKEYRKRRSSATTREEPPEHIMHSGDSDFDADESDHAKLFLRDRSRQPRRREKPVDITQSSPTKTRRPSRPEIHEEQRTSRGGLQIRSNVVPKRHVRSIPGRFSALDTDDEEEDVMHELARRAKRAADHVAQRAMGAITDFAGVSSHGQEQEPSNDNSDSRVQPQLYPSLQFGAARKLYSSKLDEVLAWTSSPHEPSSKAQPAEQKESHGSSLFSEVVSAAPAVISTIAAAAGAGGVAKLASDWVSSHANDSHKSSSVSTVPLFSSALSSSAPGPIVKETETVKEKEKEQSKELEPPKDTEQKPAPAFNWGSTAIKMPDSSDKWKCPTCDVRNGNDLSKCPCCDTAKPGGAVAATPAAAPAAPALFGGFKPPAPFTPPAGAPASSAPPSFSFGATPSPAASSSDAKSAAPPVFSVPSSNPATFAEKPTVAAATATTTAAPAPAFNWGSTAIKMPDNSDKWKCPTCDVRNGNDLSKCPCCDTAKPGGAAAATPAAAPAAPALFGGFKPPAPFTPSLFGGATTPNTSTPAVATSTPSLFGTPAATSTTESKPSAFPFSSPAPSTPATSSTANPFAPKTPTGSVPSLFGAISAPAPSSAITTLEATSKPTVPSFSFGAPATSAANTSAPLFGASTGAPSTSLFGTPTPSTAAAASVPSFGAISTAAPSSTSLFGSTTTSAPLFGNPTIAAPKFGSAATSAPAFGVSTASTPSMLFGRTSSVSSSSAPTVSDALFSSPASASTVTSSSTTSVPLFGAPAITAVSTTTSAATPAFGSVTTSPFSFGSSNPPSTTFGQPNPVASASATSTPAATAPSSTPLFGGFGATSLAAPAASTAPSTTPTTGTFGSGFAGFGASTPATPFGASTTTPSTSTPASGFTFGSAAPAATAPSTTPSFTFGSGAPAANTGMSTGGFGAAAKPTSFTFGSPTTAGFGSGLSTANNNNNNNSSSSSMMSPTMSNAAPTMTSSGTTGGFGGFGSGSSMTFGSSAPTPSVGTGFGAPAQSNPFGQSTSGFGSSSSSFGGADASGFGGNKSGFISLAGPSAAVPSFAAAAAGFGVGGVQPAQQQQSQQQGGFGGFGSNSDGQFGFQNMSNAPGGAQYAQPASTNPAQQPVGGGFSFNMGAGPAPGEMPANRKIAKMRSKKR